MVKKLCIDCLQTDKTTFLCNSFRQAKEHLLRIRINNFSFLLCTLLRIANSAYCPHGML